MFAEKGTIDLLRIFVLCTDHMCNLESFQLFTQGENNSEIEPNSEPVKNSWYTVLASSLEFLSLGVVRTVAVFLEICIKDKDM